MSKKKSKKESGKKATVHQQPGKQEKQFPSWLPYLLSVLFLLAGLLFMYQEPAFQNMSLSGADIQSQGEPLYQFRTTFEKENGEPALWIPYIFGGMPFHASGSYHLKYNIQSIYNSIPWVIRKHLYSNFVLNILIGGIFMFLLMRSFGVSILGSLISSAIFVFTTKTMGTPHVNRITSFMHIPLIFYAVKVIIEKPRWWLVFLLGGAVGSQLGSYHPQIAHFTAIFIFLYLVFTYYTRYKSDPTLKPLLIRSGYLALGLTVAIALAAIVIIPMMEYLPYSIRGAKTAVSTGTGGLSAGYATSWSLGWSEIITFIIPGFSGFGNETYWGQMPFTTFPNYIGIVAIILSVLYFIQVKSDKNRWFWLGSFIIILFIALGKNLSPVSYMMLHFVPFYNKFREPALITILNSFIVAITAGLFFQYLREINEEQKKELKKMLTRAAIILGSTLVVFVLFKSPLYDFFSGIYQAADKDMNRYTQYNVQQLQPLYEKRFSMLAGDIMRISLIGLVVIGAIWVYVQKKISLTSAGLIILVMITIDLFIPGREAVKPQYSKSKAYEHYEKGNKLADWLNSVEQQKTYRTLPIEEFGSDEYVYYRIPSAGGYHAAKMANYQAYLDDITFSNRTLIDMLSVKYIISNQRFSIPGTQIINTIDGKNIYLNKSALPYVRFVDNLIPEDDKEVIREAIKNNSFNIRTKAYVGGLEDNFLQGVSVDSARRIETNFVHEQLMEIQTSNRNQGFIVISEMHYPPGWRAYVDDEPTDIYLVNAGLMGIKVPQGSHQILLRYEQPSFYLARFISRTTYWLILGIFAYLGIMAIYRQRKNESK